MTAPLTCVMLTDEPEVAPALRVALLRPQQCAVLARNPERMRAVEVEQRHEVGVDRAERHVDDLQIARRRHAHALDELRRAMAELLERARDLRRSAVDDDRLQPDRP